jgi:hypothetical protein
VRGKKHAISLHRAEWDWRAVKQDDLLSVCFWEYARSCEAACQQVQQWLSTRIGGPNQKLTLREYLKSPAGFSGAIDIAAQELLEKMRGTYPELAALITAGNTDFPAPWLARPRKGIHLTETSIIILDFWPETFTDPEFCKRIFAVHLPIGLLAVEKTIQQFAKTYRRFAKEYGEKHGMIAKRGQKGAPPWHLLKRLAAYRIGTKFPEGAVREFAAQNPITNAPDVLPTYATKEAWSKAIGIVRGLLRRYPESLRGMR